MAGWDLGVTGFCVVGLRDGRVGPRGYKVLCSKTQGGQGWDLGVTGFCVEGLKERV
ncbi:hypothetical protein DPMN_135296 [Dreissena polymorpha]|uniref:Uncharacterized protein n=1 Tax=Dreissena polymorpha TaxID=45954 RepID=A0A9D4G193_DREPO|nr:hypothetical protein DPMN_135296 [Dreissena polymorpha]